MDLLAIMMTADNEVDLVSNLFKLSPIIGLLLIAIGYLVWNLKKKEDKITQKEKELKELNDYIRNNETENLRILERVNNTLDKVCENQKVGDNSVIKEIDNLKQLILLKLKGE